jgi:hypothetical protein
MQRIDPGVPPWPPEAGWRKSSYSNPSGNCVELTRLPVPDRLAAPRDARRTPARTTASALSPHQ